MGIVILKQIYCIVELHRGVNILILFGAMLLMVREKKATNITKKIQLMRVRAHLNTKTWGPFSYEL